MFFLEKTIQQWNILYIFQIFKLSHFSFCWFTKLIGIVLQICLIQFLPKMHNIIFLTSIVGHFSIFMNEKLYFVLVNETGLLFYQNVEY